MKDNGTDLKKKLDTVIGSLQHLLAVELAREGLPQQAIAKHLRVAIAAIVGSPVTSVRTLLTPTRRK